MDIKKSVITACSGVVLAGALQVSTVNAEEKSYVAGLNEDGKYCARVEISTVSGYTQRKMKCRTLEGWKNAGYEISTPVSIEAEAGEE